MHVHPLSLPLAGAARHPRVATFAFEVAGRPAVIGNAEDRWFGHRLAVIQAMSYGQRFVAGRGDVQAEITLCDARLVAMTPTGEDLLAGLAKPPRTLEHSLSFAPPLNTAIGLAHDAVGQVSVDGRGVREAMWSLELLYAALQRLMGPSRIDTEGWVELKLQSTERV